RNTGKLTGDRIDLQPVRSRSDKRRLTSFETLVNKYVLRLPAMDQLERMRITEVWIGNVNSHSSINRLSVRAVIEVFFSMRQYERVISMLNINTLLLNKRSNVHSC